MTREAKKYKVTIFGETFVFVSDEPEERLSRSTALIDALMNKISHQSGVADAKKIAVLAALQLASTMTRLESHIDEGLQAA